MNGEHMSFKVGDKATVTGPRRMATDSLDIDEIWDGVHPGSVVEIIKEVDEDGDVVIAGEDGLRWYIDANSLTPVEPEDEITVDMTFPTGEEIKIRVTGFSDPIQALIALKRAGSDETLAGLAEYIDDVLEG
jgi:hypothetical protein